MICYLCNRSIAKRQLHQHHLIPKCEGGTETAPVHRACHVNYHSSEGHFRKWGRAGGRLSAITCRWAFTLSGIKDNPTYELHRQYPAAWEVKKYVHRQFYRLYYAEAV